VKVVQNFSYTNNYLLMLRKTKLRPSIAREERPKQSPLTMQKCRFYQIINRLLHPIYQLKFLNQCWDSQWRSKRHFPTLIFLKFRVRN